MTQPAAETPGEDPLVEALTFHLKRGWNTEGMGPGEHQMQLDELSRNLRSSRVIAVFANFDLCIDTPMQNGGPVYKVYLWKEVENLPNLFQMFLDDLQAQPELRGREVLALRVLASEKSQDPQSARSAIVVQGLIQWGDNSATIDWEPAHLSFDLVPSQECNDRPILHLDAVFGS